MSYAGCGQNVRSLRLSQALGVTVDTLIGPRLEVSA